MAFFDFLKDLNREKKAVKSGLNFIGRGAKATASTAGKVATVPYNEGRRVVAAVTGNEEAERNAARQANAGLSFLAKAPTTGRDIAVGAGRSIARIPETIVRSAAQAEGDLLERINPNYEASDFSQQDENTGLRAAIYGDEPVQTYQERAEGVAKKTGLAPPLIVAGTLGLDVGGGPGKAVGKSTIDEGIKRLAKATTEQEVRQIMKGSPKELVDAVAPAITVATDSNAIRTILDKATSPRVSVDAPIVGQDIIQATVPGATRAPSPVENVVTALRGQPAAPGQSPITGIEKLHQQQAQLYRVERSARLKKAQNAGTGLEGREALYSQLASLKGELPKVNADTLKEHLNSRVSPDDVTEILNTLRSSPELRDFEPITAQNAIVKLFDEGKLPTPKEWELLEKSVGPEFVNTIKGEAVSSITRSQKFKNFLVQVPGVPKALLAVDPASALIRQGGVLGARFKKEWASAAKDNVKFLGSQQAYDDMLLEVSSRSTAPLMKRARLALAGPDGIHEEQFASTIAEKIPYVGAPVRAADRAYTGFLTKLRADSFDHIMNDLVEAGTDINTLTDKQLKSIGRFINTASGRGNLGEYLERHSTTLGETLFSPRLWKSRLDLINPIYYATLDPIARKYALQASGNYASIAAMVLGLAALGGAEIETDARSSDFLKIKVGNTRYDILGGLQQNLVLAHRELPGSIGGVKTYIGSGEKKSSLSGDVVPLDKGGFGDPNRLSILSDFIQNKEAPTLAATTRLIRGSDTAGNPTNVGKEALGLITPLAIQDTAKTIKDSGVIEGTLKSLPTNVGIGVGTYSAKDTRVSDKPQKYLDKLKKEGASKEVLDANKLFFQTLRTAPKKKNASDDIKAAINAGNINKAIELAKKYNQRYSGVFEDWRKQYSKYRGDEILIDQYNKNLISEDLFNKWVEDIQGGEL